MLLGNLFRDQLDRYGELEHVAERWRAARSRLPDGRVARRQRRRPSGRRPRATAATGVAFGLDDPRHARPALQHAADSQYCVRCGAPVRVRGGLRRPPRRLPLPPLRPRPAGARRRRAEIELHGLEAAAFTLDDARRAARGSSCALPGLYNVYNALGAAALAQALGTPLEEIAAGLERFGAAFGRFERIAVGDKRLLILLIKNPAGANEAVRTLLEGGAPTLAPRRAQRRDRRRKGRLLDLGRRLRAAARPGERLIASGDRAAELALRCVYGGLAEDALEVEPDLGSALDRGLELTPPGGELVVLPTYTAMLALRAIVAERGLVAAVLGGGVRRSASATSTRTT